jgi:hypothetical protein
MLKVNIPFKTFAKINTLENCKGKHIKCSTTGKEGIFDYIDILGICRTKQGIDITTVKQANIIINVKNEEELISVVQKYNLIQI